MRGFFHQLLGIALAFLVSGCATGSLRGLGTSEALNPDLPRVASLRVIPEVSSVAFEWSILNDPRIDGYYLYRQESNQGAFERVAKIESRFGGHFVDTKLKPDTLYLYKIVAYHQATQSLSPDSEIAEVRTLSLAPLEFVQAMSRYPRKVKILWRPHENPRIASYLIEREESGRWKEIAKVENRLLAEYLDKGLEDGAEYRYRVIAKTHEGVQSAPSEVVSATTKPKPPVVQGVSASDSLPKKIELRWEKSSQEDTAHYKVYRASWEKWGYTVQSQSEETSYMDAIDSDGKEYFYKVSAVDRDGIESLLQESPTRGSTLGLPATPVMEYARIENNQAVLRWARSDERAVEYVVYKRQGGFFGKVERFVSVTDVNFYDREVVAGESYRYSVAAVDRHGLESKRSDEVVLQLPKEAR